MLPKQSMKGGYCEDCQQATATIIALRSLESHTPRPPNDLIDALIVKYTLRASLGLPLFEG